MGGARGEEKAILTSSVVSEILGNHHVCVELQLFTAPLSWTYTLRWPDLGILFGAFNSFLGLGFFNFFF